MANRNTVSEWTEGGGAIVDIDRDSNFRVL